MKKLSILILTIILSVAFMISGCSQANKSDNAAAQLML